MSSVGTNSKMGFPGSKNEMIAAPTPPTKVNNLDAKGGNDDPKSVDKTALLPLADGSMMQSKKKDLANQLWLEED